jgi:flavin reductase ActVB
MNVDPATYRAVISRVPTSVAVVTTIDGAEPYGMTIGSLGRLSTEPALVLFSVAQNARAHDVLRAADRYCVSILAHNQMAVALRFVRHDPQRFRCGMFRMQGLPAVAGAAAWLLCVRDEVLRRGDHTLVIARVAQARDGSTSPLVYHSRSFRTVIPVADADLPDHDPAHAALQPAGPHR